ncbi:hypothetical protein [Clostridium tarantellae]|uniref:DUF3784 domain-containing protein n=1 Tax=Clostridium tarantellae TaxID=39493 RepID=A0A6I1MTL6_9CLOT|nr:hypothetical protein [Clostridium tarantellae]MPQ43579.1 hypothetical protein [Clostridium tarantellae]
MNNLITSLIFILLGVFNFFIGKKIKKEQIIGVISGFDKQKDDRKVLCDLIGNNFMAMGVLGILISIFYMTRISKISLGMFIFLYVFMMIITIINIAFKSDKYRKKGKL